MVKEIHLMDLRLGRDHRNPWTVGRHAESHRVSLVILSHGTARSDEDLVTERRLADMGLRASHDDAILSFFDNSDVIILMTFLLGRPEDPTSLDPAQAHAEGQ